jgi:hypothetical protein
LLTDLADEVRSAGGSVWSGTAYEGDARAYGPLTQMLDDAARATSPTVLGAWLGASTGLVARVAPAVRTVLGARWRSSTTW